MIDVWTLTGCPKDTFNKWLLRGNLQTDFPASRQGVTREFTKQNALEIYFFTALTNIGFDVGQAEHLVANFMSQYKKGSLPKFVLFNRRSDKMHEGWNDDLTIHRGSIVVEDDIGNGEIIADDAQPDRSMDDETISAVSYSVIFPQEIAARVDEAFGK